jgi:hypothetical protein
MKTTTNMLNKQYAVIDRTEGLVFIGDYKPAVRVYKQCCEDAYEEAFDGFDNLEDVTVRFLVVMTSSQPEELRDGKWKWVQGDPDYPRVEVTDDGIR